MSAIYDFLHHRDYCESCSKVLIASVATYNETCLEGAKLLKKFLHESEEERVLNKRIETVGLPNV